MILISLEGLSLRSAGEIDPGRKHRLLEGLDDIGLSLQHADAIREFEQRHRSAAPWLFQGPSS